VGIGDGDLGGNMGHDVSVVDHSISLGDAGSDEGSEVLVSHSGLTESVELVDVSEKGVDVQGSDRGKSRTQAVSSHVDLGIAVERSQLLNFTSNVSLNTSKGVVETLMNLATSAARVRNLLKTEDT
jgi:hypothetical protein